MLTFRGLSSGLFSTAFTLAILCSVTGTVRSQPTDLDAMIDALRQKIVVPSDQTTPNADGSVRLNLTYPTTLLPEPKLLEQLQVLFAKYFDAKINLTPILAKLVRESAVASVPGQGYILYNPANMLFLLLPEGWRDDSEIRVATLEDVGDILKQKKPTNPLIAAYGQGLQEFALLSELMKNADAAAALQVIWNTAPRSEDDKERMRYLLLRPIEQAREIRNETPACKQSIDHFIDDVRAGRRSGIPRIQGLTDILKPTRFIQTDNQIFLVLSDDLIARYYVIAQFDLNTENCLLAQEKPIFAAQLLAKR
jgi:hypothetical protein